MKKYVLITGRIARPALVRMAETIKDVDLEIISLPYTVAALMSTEYIAKELARKNRWSGEEIIVTPGLCQGSLQPIIEATRSEVVRGPSDLVDLPAFFQSGKDAGATLTEGNKRSSMPDSPVQILAEIVNAPRMSEAEILKRALYFRAGGASIIDLGGDVHAPFPRLREVVAMLKHEGFKVSVDSHQAEDMLAANSAGVDLILSVNSRNLEIAKSLDCPVVVIPDDGESLESLYRNMERLESWNVHYLADPILPPLTMGLAAGIGRYLKVRKEFPDCEMLMGLGNVTELLDADSTGVNALLAGIAGELRINYILTTEVSHRARGAVREASLACRLIHQAIMEERVPKHLDESLLTIKDPSGNAYRKEELQEMQQVIRDKNYRIFVDDQIYIFNAHGFWHAASAAELFAKLEVRDPGHAFYLGRELGKAETALQLGKKYVQDNPLRWGYLSEEPKPG